MSVEPQVLHLRSSAGLYGAEYMLLGLIPALRELGLASDLLCLDNPYVDIQRLHAEAQKFGVPASRIPCRGRFDFATVRALRERMAALPSAIWHVHDYKSAFYAWLARGRKARPIVATLHGHVASDNALRAYEQLEIWLMRRFDAVCIVSEAMRAVLENSGIVSGRVHLIENGIDVARFRPDACAWPRAEFGIDAAAILIGAAMRLSDEKNPLGLIEAFAPVAREVPEVVLAIAGDGPLREAVRDRAETLGIQSRVRLLGARDGLEGFYPMIDIFVLPSRSEGLPLVLLEAMAAKRPIVATGVGQIPVVVAGLPAHLVRADDITALTQALLRVIRQPQTAGLRERVLANYSLTRMARDYAAVYSQLGVENELAAA